MYEVITTVNTVLFQIDIDMDKFDEELAIDTVNESKLNKDIQEKLKPTKILSNLNPNYSQLKKNREYDESNLQVNIRQ